MKAMVYIETDDSNNFNILLEKGDAFSKMSEQYWNSTSKIKYYKGENEPHSRAKARVKTILEDNGWEVYEEVPFDVVIKIGVDGIHRHRKIHYDMDLLAEKRLAGRVTEIMAVECDGKYHFATKKAEIKTENKAEFIRTQPYGVDSFVSFTVEELDGNGIELLNDGEVRERLGLCSSAISS